MTAAGATAMLEQPTPNTTNPVYIRRGRLSELAEQLEQLKATRRDVVADTRTVEMLESSVALRIPGIGNLPLTRHATTQLAQKVGIPQGYFDRMATAAPKLLAQNVNTWLGAEPERRLFRAANGHVRAILSDRYRLMDNEDLAFLVADRARVHGAEILNCSLTEQRMQIKITIPQHQEVLGKLTAVQIAEARRRGLMPDGNTHAHRPELDLDYVVPGLMVSNSEVGSGAFKVEPFVYRLVCYNSLVGETTLNKIHIGGRMGDGEVVYFTEDTKRLDDAALWAKVRDVIDATFDPKAFRTLVARMVKAGEVPVENPVDVTDAVAKNLGLTDDRKQALLRYFTNEGHSVLGLAHGVTRLAQDIEDPDAQVDLERAAGAILLKPEEYAVLA